MSHRTIRTGILAQGRGRGMTKEEFKRKETFEEAGREREFAAEQATTRFERSRELIGSVISQFDTDDGDGVDEGGLAEIESSLRASGEKRQAQASGALAKRGIFTSGASAATAARIQGETEAAVAGGRAELRESAADRRARKKAARLQAVTQITGQIASGAFL